MSDLDLKCCTMQATRLWKNSTSSSLRGKFSRENKYSRNINSKKLNAHIPHCPLELSVKHLEIFGPSIIANGFLSFTVHAGWLNPSEHLPHVTVCCLSHVHGTLFVWYNGYAHWINIALSWTKSCNPHGQCQLTCKDNYSFPHRRSFLKCSLQFSLFFHNLIIVWAVN